MIKNVSEVLREEGVEKRNVMQLLFEFNLVLRNGVLKGDVRAKRRLQ